MRELVALYCDGGVIAVNPSKIGGTYAWRLLYSDGLARGAGAVLTVQQNGGPVTNNQTEMLALLSGLMRCPDTWAGTIYSDSQVTLGRIFLGWKWSNIPTWMHKIFQEERKRLVNWEQIKYTLLDGHPTKAQLLSGIGKRGHPVSEYNVWCDKACREAGESWLAVHLQG
jgi:ribonuclease HI